MGSYISSTAYPKTARPTTYSKFRNVDTYLKGKKWPDGLRETLLGSLSLRGSGSTTQQIKYRYFILDDSTSMRDRDGRKVSSQGKIESCSRWEELMDCVDFYKNVSVEAMDEVDYDGMSIFTLLNNFDHPFIEIGKGAAPNQSKLLDIELAKVNDDCSLALKDTPLCKKLKEIIKDIKTKSQNSKSKFSITLLTDGESSDGSIHHVMAELPSNVSFVVRICSQQDIVYKYWDELDTNYKIGIDIDVLGNLEKEEKQVAGFNPWITYSYSIHRLREFGVDLKEFDDLDEVNYLPDQLDTVSNKVNPNLKKLVTLTKRILGDIQGPGGYPDITDTVQYPNEKIWMADFVRFLLEYRYKYTGESDCFSAMNKRKQPFIRTDVLMNRKPFTRMQHFFLEKNALVEYKYLCYPVRKEYGDICMSIFLLSIFATSLVFLNVFTLLSYLCLTFFTSYICNGVNKSTTNSPLDVIRNTTIRPFKKNTIWTLAVYIIWLSVLFVVSIVNKDKESAGFISDVILFMFLTRQACMNIN